MLDTDLIWRVWSAWKWWLSLHCSSYEIEGDYKQSKSSQVVWFIFIQENVIKDDGLREIMVSFMSEHVIVWPMSSNWADFSTLIDTSIIEWLDRSVVCLTLIDQLSDLLQAGFLNPNNIFADEPLNSFIAGGGGQGSLIMENVSGGFKINGKLLLDWLLGIKVPGIERILKVSRFCLKENAENCKRFVLSLVNNMKFQIIFFTVDLMLWLVVEVELDGIVNICEPILFDGDGGEMIGGLQVFIVMIVGDLGVEIIFGGDTEREGGIASFNSALFDVDGGLLLTCLAFSAPMVLISVILAHGHANKARQKQAQS